MVYEKVQINIHIGHHHTRWLNHDSTRFQESTRLAWRLGGCQANLALTLDYHGRSTGQPPCPGTQSLPDPLKVVIFVMSGQ